MTPGSSDGLCETHPLGLGESYGEGWWNAEVEDGFLYRVLVEPIRLGSSLPTTVFRYFDRPEDRPHILRWPTPPSWWPALQSSSPSERSSTRWGCFT